MNLQSNIETYLTLFSIAFSLIGSYLIVRKDWRRYGLLYLLTAISGNILCYIFVRLGFYSFPYRLFSSFAIMPFDVVLTMFPFIVLVGVNYAPKPFLWKIPFYWVLVHIGMLFETLALQYTNLIEYNVKWDFWDSYTWWWLFLIGFEWISTFIIPDSLRNPIDYNSIRYNRIGWFIIHFILIVTIFLGGVYLGFVLFS